jgi:hypothetical protein
MSRSPFLDDPFEQVSKHIAAAMTSPMEEVRAMHIRAAEHLAQLAKESGITPRQKHNRSSKDA